MKKINDFLPKTESVDYDEIIDRFMADPIVSDFIIKNDLTNETIKEGINDILTFMEEKDKCNQCKGLYECKLNTTGYWPRLELYNGSIQLQYEKCQYNQMVDSSRNIDAFYVPKKIFQASLDDFDMLGPVRKEIHRFMMRFIKDYDRENYVKGMYISGPYGTGKTYILATMANELAKKGFHLTFAYYPDLVRELKSSIGSGSFEDKIESLKTTELLFLDDIGGESPNAFIRDEVLGPILQYRLLDQKPTFFSSNLKSKVLIDAMAKDNSSLEKTKSLRIVERIRALTDEFELTEKPHIS
ncbi:MAG: primosomal protein DnaI [Bacilli bacterium]|nr:primosomal protein DnaI [Bacilli bacterium]MBN2877765.1 primosomal protein DnaI [Bacilli bacterium]